MKRCPICGDRCRDDQHVIDHLRREHDKTRTEAEKMVERIQQGKSPEEPFVFEWFLN